MCESMKMKVDCPMCLQRATGEKIGRKVELSELCDYCRLMGATRVEIALCGYITSLVSLLHHQSSEIDEAELDVMPFEPELTKDGFILKFENGMELGLDCNGGLIFYRGADSMGTYTGQVALPASAKQAHEIFGYIVGMLVNLPSKPEDAKSIIDGDQN